MKFSSAIVAAVAPAVLAKSVRNSYPQRRSPHAHAHADADAYALPQVIEPVEESETIILLWANPGGDAPTQVFNPAAQLPAQTIVGGNEATAIPLAGGGTTVVPAGATAVVPGAAATHTVTVGGPVGEQFVPDSIEANVGDMVLFTFLSQNHTATQSAFATPCEPLSGGMDSGFMPNLNNSVTPPPAVVMQVMVATPLWFFCRQKGHCGNGMTFSINPTAAKTQAMFQAMAIAQNGTGQPSAITGGTPASGSSVAPAAGTESALTPLGSSSSTSSDPDAAGALQPLASSSSDSGTGLVTGSGTLGGDGSCTCHVTCDMSGSFPAVQAQGINSFGGMPGSIPVGDAEAQ